MVKILDNIRQRPEHHKKAVSVFLSLILTSVFVLGWAFQKDIISPNVAKSERYERVTASTKPASPTQSYKRSVKKAFGELSSVYSAFKASVSSVIVPFITGIEIYERK